MQQSAAFKILRTRLKTVPSYSFSGDQVEQTSSGNPYSHILHHIPSGSQISEDGDVNQDVGTSNSHNGINFTTRLHQFEQKQKQHRVHAKAQAKSRKISTSSSKDVQRLEESQHQPPLGNNGPLSRSSRKGPGQLQL
ncbi:protein VAC14-like [Populus alba x Populus x berolinensis]|nr:protein VAC14-like [Populus alba x Populus x berolinensis]